MFARKETTLLVTAACALSILASSADADVMSVPVTVSPVVNRVEGHSVAILECTLPPLRQGEGLAVQSAVIDWEHRALDGRGVVRVKAFDASSSAVLADVIRGEEETSETFYPQDFRRLGRGQIRLDVTRLVRRLVSGRGGTVRLAVATREISPTNLGASGPAAPTLVIRYGFLGPLKGLFAEPE